MSKTTPAPKRFRIHHFADKKARLGEQGYKPLVNHIRNGEITLANLRDASQAAIEQKTKQ